MTETLLKAIFTIRIKTTLKLKDYQGANAYNY